MRLIFWAAAAIIVYTYAAYPVWLWIRSRWRARPVLRSSYFPSISIVMVVRNEAIGLMEKLKNISQIEYPSDLVESVIVSDGSTDETNAFLAHATLPFASKIIVHSQARGKAASLNEAIAAAAGEIVIFVDARQQVECDAVRRLMENFADVSVGCASGELLLGDSSGGESVRGLGLYWKIEKKIRDLESLTGSVVGATGALYAVRRRLLVPLPPETLLDDVYIPMHVLRQGFRVVFDSRARVWDQADLGIEREFARKVRTLTGNYQILQLAPWLCGRSNSVRFEFISHKLMRLLVPFCLVALLSTSFLIHGPVYRSAMFLQIVFYALSLWAWNRKSRQLPLGRVANAAFALVLLNTAAVVAFTNFITGRKVAWGRSA
jgi:poly-beta-1,6-N-acetyl-D-glucosamine synthase